MAIRTDMALESNRLWEQSAGTEPEKSGILTQEKRLHGLAVKTVKILNEAGRRALHKPIGTYHTLELDSAQKKCGEAIEQAVQALAQLLRPMLGRADSVLVVGLGNDGITPDAIGPKTLENVIITRHLKTLMSQKLPGFCSVCAAQPGVLGATGLESAEIVRALVRQSEIRMVVAVDALATANPARICRSIQLTDTGIEPGSGVGNRRARLCAQTLGVPVLAIGVPTLTDFGKDGLMVIPRDIDEQIAHTARILGYGLNLALHRGITFADIPRFLP